MNSQSFQFINGSGQTLVIRVSTCNPTSKETAIAICKYALPLGFNSIMTFSSRSKPDIEVFENEERPH